MKCRASGYGYDTELLGKIEDQSLLWKPTHPLVSSFLETKRVYENGTDEIRSLLVQECSLIYECNVCRNIFRSLTCFITHKQVYCCTSSNQLNPNNLDGCQFRTASSIDKAGSGDNGEVSSNDIQSHGEPRDETVIVLSKVPNDGECNVKIELQHGGGNGVNPTPSMKNNDSIELEPENMNEGHENEHQNISIVASVKKKELQISLCDDGINVCNVCKLCFVTDKLLKTHVHKKHMALSYVFQCPLCCNVFRQPATIVRHLCNDHKKSIKSIRSLRDMIQKRRLFSATTQVNNKNSKLSQHNGKLPDNTSNSINIQKIQAVNITQLMNENKISVSDDHLINSKSDLLQYPISANNDTVSEESVQKIKCSETKKQQDMKKNNKTDSKHLPCLCKICHKHFSAVSNLRRHISMFHYRTRKFGCKICEYRAYRKYDVINHLGHIHKILGDKDSMSLEYITLYEEKSYREDIDDDVVLITDEKKIKPKNESVMINHKVQKSIERISESSPTHFKNKGCKTMFLSGRIQKSVPRERQMLQRPKVHSLSKTDSFLTNQKRPKRNRIKPVKKDFVYDMSNILKKDMPESECNSERSPKRRNTILVVNNSLSTEKPTSESTSQRSEVLKSLTSYPIELIKGSAQRIAVSFVHDGRAAYAYLPQIPTERPQVRVRQTSTCRADFTTVPVIEATDLIEARLKAKLLDDSFLENLSMAASNEFKMKPRLALPQSTINSLLQKVDLSLRKHMEIKSENVESNEDIKYDLNLCKKSEVLTEVSVKQEIPSEAMSFSTIEHINFIGDMPNEQTREGIGLTISNGMNFPQKPKKRIKLMECLVETKSTNRESLLRLALEN